MAFFSLLLLQEDSQPECIWRPALLPTTAENWFPDKEIARSMDGGLL